MMRRWIPGVHNGNASHIVIILVIIELTLMALPIPLYRRELNRVGPSNALFALFMTALWAEYGLVRLF